MNPDIFLAMLSTLVVHIPAVTVLLVGVVLALQRRTRDRRNASMALAGLLFVLASLLIFTPLTLWLTWFSYEQTGSARYVGITGGAVRAAHSLVFAVGIALMLAAILARHPGKRSERAARLGHGTEARE